MEVFSVVDLWMIKGVTFIWLSSVTFFAEKRERRESDILGKEG
jgi:hypothetical protein